MASNSDDTSNKIYRSASKKLKKEYDIISDTMDKDSDVKIESTIHSTNSACEASDGLSGDEFKKGLWTPEEDAILSQCVQKFKEGNWSTIAAKSGLNRSGKSCRLRWVKHLSPTVRNGPLSDEEQRKVIELQSIHGNKWALMASMLPGRSDNTIKNFWNSHRKRSLRRAQQKNLIQRTSLSSNNVEKASRFVVNWAEKQPKEASSGVEATSVKEASIQMNKPEASVLIPSANPCLEMKDESLAFRSVTEPTIMSENFLDASPRMHKRLYPTLISCGFNTTYKTQAGGSVQASASPQSMSVAAVNSLTLRQETIYSNYENSYIDPQESSLQKVKRSLQFSATDQQVMSSEFDQRVIERRERHLKEARRLWDHVLQSPTGMCNALRESMPPNLVSACFSEPNSKPELVTLFPEEVQVLPNISTVPSMPNVPPLLAFPPAVADDSEFPSFSYESLLEPPLHLNGDDMDWDPFLPCPGLGLEESEFHWPLEKPVEDLSAIAASALTKPTPSVNELRKTEESLKSCNSTNNSGSVVHERGDKELAGTSFPKPVLKCRMNSQSSPRALTRKRASSHFRRNCNSVKPMTLQVPSHNSFFATTNNREEMYESTESPSLAALLCSPMFDSTTCIWDPTKGLLSPHTLMGLPP